MKLNASPVAPPVKGHPFTRWMVEIASRRLASAFGHGEQLAKAIFAFALSSVQAATAVGAYARLAVRCEKAAEFEKTRSAKDADRVVDDYDREIETGKASDLKRIENAQRTGGPEEIKNANERLLLTSLPRGEKLGLNKTQREMVVVELRQLFLAPKGSSLSGEIPGVIIGKKGANLPLALWLLESFMSEKDWTEFQEALAEAGADEEEEDEEEEEEGADAVA